MYGASSSSNNRRTFWLIGIAIFLLVALVFSGRLWESVDAHENVVIQSIGTGKLKTITTPGWKWQGLGTVTRYPKRANYAFSYPVRFNDGGHGTMFGSIQFDYPSNDEALRLIHIKFRSPEAFQTQLVEKVVNKAMYMTGPLMSSRESYAERRNDLIRFVEDQVEFGVYQTRTRTERRPDPITGQEKTVLVVEIIRDSSGTPLRQESSALLAYGVIASNFALDSLPYDAEVEGQIRQQQALTMQVQTSMAQARQAEQERITSEQRGQATATEARWRQEAIRAESVTAAQRRLDVARLAAQEAEQYRRAEILRGEGEATRRRLVMQADGALQQKLEAWVQVNQSYAEHFAQYGGSWVPQVQMGGGGAGNANGATGLMDLLTIQTARQLGLDLGTTTNRPRQASPQR